MLLRPRQRAMVGWAQEVGHGWLLPKHQAPTTPLFLEEKKKRPALNLLGQDVLCLEALSPLKMQKEAARRTPICRIMGEGGRGSRGQTSDIMGFPQPCWLPSLGEADPGQPPELCLRTPGLRDPRLGGASACGQGPARQGGVAPPLSARPPARARLRSARWRSSAPCRRHPGTRSPESSSCWRRREG